MLFISICYFIVFIVLNFIQQPQTGQQPVVQAAASTTSTPKEQETTTADPNADEDIFAKFEDSPSPAANQVYELLTV